MKRFFGRFSTRAKIVAATAIAVIAIAVPAAVIAGFGPDRPTKVYNGPGTPGFDYPTFNSFTNVPGIGDERRFFTGMYPNGTVLTDPLAQVKQGDELTLQVYVHNGADPKYNESGQGVARNTKVKVVLPNGAAKSQQATAYVSADNTQPTQVFDTLDFAAENGGFFELDYVEGSAHVRGNHINTTLPDSVVTTGATIGTDALDGNISGCFEKEVLVTLKVKVNMPRYTISKQVGVASGTTEWKESVDINKNDKAAWLITFKNTGATQLKNVKIVDEVPAGLTVVPGSVMLINGNYPNGYTYPDTAIQANGRQVNVDIGNYNPDAAGVAYLVFKTTATPPADACDKVTYVNKAYATPTGYGAIWDTANVVVDTKNPCQGPAYSCDLLKVESLADRKVRVAVDYTAKNGATFSNVTYNFGDGSANMLTDKQNVEHQYAKDGTYTIAATIRFKVDNQDKTATSEQCSKQVTFTSGKPVTPGQLPNTGPADMAGIFAAVSIAGALAHRLFWARRKLMR